jgi:hypothetical protein
MACLLAWTLFVPAPVVPCCCIVLLLYYCYWSQRIIYCELICLIDVNKEYNQRNETRINDYLLLITIIGLVKVKMCGELQALRSDSIIRCALNACTEGV